MNSLEVHTTKGVRPRVVRGNNYTHQNKTDNTGRCYFC